MMGSFEITQISKFRVSKKAYGIRMHRMHTRTVVKSSFATMLADYFSDKREKSRDFAEEKLTQ